MVSVQRILEADAETWALTSWFPTKPLPHIVLHSEGQKSNVRGSVQTINQSQFLVKKSVYLLRQKCHSMQKKRGLNTRSVRQHVTDTATEKKGERACKDTMKSYPIRDKSTHTEGQIYAQTQTQYWHWPWSSSSLVVARGGERKNKEERRQKGTGRVKGEREGASVRHFLQNTVKDQRLGRTRKRSVTQSPWRYASVTTKCD